MLDSGRHPENSPDRYSPIGGFNQPPQTLSDSESPNAQPHLYIALMLVILSSQMSSTSPTRYAPYIGTNVTS